MKYRPQNYENPHIKELPDGNLQYGGQQYYDFEAGYDKCLEDLEPLIREIAPSGKLVDIIYGENKGG